MMRVMRVRWITAAVAWLAIALGAACDGMPGGGDERPDVQLLVVDTLRASSLSAYGYPRTTSPSLTAFAESAVVFEDVVASAPWTLPSVASILTGNYARVHGLRARQGTHATTTLRPGLVTLAEAFHEAGYRTIALVSNPWVSGPEHGLARGFDVYRSFDGFDAVGSGSADVLHENAQQALEFSDDRPVFLYVHYMEPHGPWQGAPDATADYGPAPPELVRALTADEAALVNAEPALRLPGATRLDDYIDAYDDAIHAWDRSFGRYVAWLEASGRLDRTVVAVTSDHGEEFVEHGRWGHGHAMYQELLRVPWVLALPGERSGRRIAHPVSLIDVGPTLLAAAGVAVPGTMVGIDALGPAAATSAEARDLFSETDIGDYARFDPNSPKTSTVLRRGTAKLIADRSGLRLFDLASDPGEQAPQRVASGERLPRRLESWKRATRERAQGLGETGQREVPAEVREQLRALGYGDD